MTDGQQPGGSRAWLRDYPWKMAYRPADDPLRNFFIPALSRSIRYDRMAGFFSSSALAAAAAGVAGLVARGGRMRLLVGAQLSQEDVEAILRGVSLQERLSGPLLSLLGDERALADALVRKRLEVLAWMVANGQLNIRVTVEATPGGEPIQSAGYFHAKVGILDDVAGDSIAFLGSINESETAWQNNYERFQVFTSWGDPGRVLEEADSFQRLWENTEPGWVSVSLPEAVRQELVRMAPRGRPTTEPTATDFAQAVETERWLAQFIRDAPHLVHGGWRTGVETAGLEPFPHQRAVAYEVAYQYPVRRLFADEVGLGKTIEAGLVLRTLMLSGVVRRCLVLVPRSLVKQWHEELRDKFAITAPWYNRDQFVYFDPGSGPDRTEPVSFGKTPWTAHPVMIASAQLMKREERSESLLSAPDWDLLIVDEAHHARRRDFLDLTRYRPNKLMQLLERLRGHTKGLLMLTATPMQVHPVEVWDLLKLLGLPGLWGESQDAFINFYRQLRLPSEQIDWASMLRMGQGANKAWGWDSNWERDMLPLAGPVGLMRIRTAVENASASLAKALSPAEQRLLLDALKAHSPVQRLMYRHTRALLRKYWEAGILRQQVAERRPFPRWLGMHDDEERLYRSVESYLKKYFKRYEEERRGLGFIMTVYRERLTSSLYALRESLKRHMRVLAGQWADEEQLAGLTLEDIEEFDLDDDRDISDLLEEVKKRPGLVGDEIEDLRKLLDRAKDMPEERKAVELREVITSALRQTNQVLVFTKYTDTMDFLREQLRPVFGKRLACFSVRGGEVWNPTTESWVRVKNKQVRDDFRAGTVQVLVCTDAASEGLNLQSCNVVVNYDMPWNPMRVEQRIGRVDRIGQQRPEVFIYHLMYEGTVEADIYRALGARIEWFKTMVGELQPILQQARQALQKAALVTDKERAGLVAEFVGATNAYDVAAPTANWTPGAQPPEASAPVTLVLLDRVFAPVAVQTGHLVPEGDRSYRLGSKQGPLVTFDPARADSDAEPGDLLTYGTPEFDTLLRVPGPRPRKDISRREKTVEGRRWLGYYRFDNGAWRPIRTLDELSAAVKMEISADDIPDIADAAFESDVKATVFSKQRGASGMHASG